MPKRKPSLFNEPQDGCWICKNPNVVMHHIYGGHGRRPVSDAEGCYIFLCPYHHNMSDFGVHFDKSLDTSLKQMCQRRWEEREGLEGEEAHDAFRKIFGISYL